MINGAKTMQAAKKISTIRPRVVGATQDLASEVAALRMMVATLLAGRPTELLAAHPQPAPQKGPADIVGQQFFCRVSGERVLVEVIEDTRDPRRPYRLRRVDNGKVLHRLRSRQALHTDDAPLPFPPRKGKK